RARLDLSVVVGEHDLTRAEHSQERHRVAKVIRHGQYRYPSFQKDIALRLSDKITWDQYKQPVCLPSVGSPPVQGDPATVAGWGWLDEYSKGGQQAKVLQRVHVPVVTATTCSSWFSEAERGVTVRRGQLCAGYKSGGKDGCQGDSGGPLVSRRNGHYTLIGVVSAGIGCARPNLPGIYTDVHEYLDWIVENASGS
ncbi:prostasin-like, partial [Pollicipes pollicipes]|uniref:prostasin-like n=1 Tax=Pollicipes pollicipes TaxID=41117 RepID=UPI00188537C4